jgi:hypothetical protein
MTTPEKEQLWNRIGRYYWGRNDWETAAGIPRERQVNLMEKEYGHPIEDIAIIVDHILTEHPELKEKPADVRRRLIGVIAVWKETAPNRW